MIESVDSTYVIIRGVKTSDNSLGDDVYLSFKTEPCSYKEDLASENGQEYGITLELLDPDGVFISKMYSYVLNQYKHFFTNLNVDYTASGQITALGDTKYRELVAQYVRDNPGRIVRSNGFTTFDLEGLEGYDYSTGLMDDGSDPFTIPLTLDDVESMSVNQINNIITGATKKIVLYRLNNEVLVKLESLYNDEVDLLNQEDCFKFKKTL